MGIFRLFLSLVVVRNHMASFSLMDGMMNSIMSVQSFFIVSGFYTSMILKTKYSSMRSFWINRILRLYPIYLLIICLILLIDPNNFGKIFLDSSYSVLTRLYVFIYNIFMIGSDWSLWLEITPEKTLDFVMNFRDSFHSIHLKHSLLSVAWTISLEIYFYIIAPFLIKYPKKILVLLMILSLSLRFLFLYPLGFSYDPYAYRFFPTELVFFILGIFSYYYAKQFLKFGWIALTNVIILAFFIEKIPIDFRILKLIYFISLTIAIPFLFKLFKNNVIDRKIGDLSYGIYLIHPLVIWKLSVLNIITSPIEIIRQKLAKDQK